MFSMLIFEMIRYSLISKGNCKSKILISSLSLTPYSKYNEIPQLRTH